MGNLRAVLCLCCTFVLFASVAQGAGTTKLPAHSGFVRTSGLYVSPAGPFSLQSALQSCIEAEECIIDATDPGLGDQVLTQNPFKNLELPITLITGDYTVEWDTSSVPVDLPSHTHWIMQRTQLLTTNPTSPVIGFGMGSGGMIDSRITSTTGAIEEGSSTILLEDPARVEPGTMVGIMGAGGSEPLQATKLSSPILSSDTTIPVDSVFGWGNQPNFLRIENEYLYCTGYEGTSFVGCSRGALGSAPSSHPIQVPVEAVTFFVSQVLSVNGNSAILADSARSSVSSALVYVGSTDISLEGSGCFDGAQVQNAPTHYMTGLDIRLASNVVVGSGICFRNLEHGGVMLTASKFNRISGKYENNGKPALGFGMGTDVTCFEQCTENVIQTISHSNGNLAVMIDDRTDHLTFYSGISRGNVVSAGPVTGYLGALSLEGGSSDNTVDFQSISSTVYGVQIFSIQWTTNPKPSGNVIRFSSIDGHTGIAFRTLGYGQGDNSIIGGYVSSGLVSVQGGDYYTFSDPAGLHTGFRGRPLATETTIDLSGVKPSGEPFTASVRVTSQFSTSLPEGTVKIYDGNALVGTYDVERGMSSPTLNFLSGDHSVRAVFSGGENFSGSESAPVTFRIEPDFAVSSSVENITASFGQVVTFNITLSPLHGDFPEAIRIGCSGMECSVSPEIVYLGTQSASATVKVHVADLPARGKTFPILGLFAPMLGLAILGMSGVRRRALLACLSGIAVLAIVACGGDASRPKSMQQRIEVQRKYGVTITADSGKRRHTIIKTVYLQQASAD